MGEQCKKTLYSDWHSRRCSRKATKDGYCKQHHPDTQAERDRKADEVWAARQEASPSGQLKVARATILDLEATIERMQSFPVMLRKMWSGGEIEDWLARAAQRPDQPNSE